MKERNNKRKENEPEQRGPVKPLKQVHLPCSHFKLFEQYGWFHSDS